MEAQFLPSGKFVKTVLAILVLTVLIFAFQKGSPAIQKAISDFMSHKTAQKTEKNEDAYADYRNLDTDKDGLLDWEEALYGTNSEIADTDGDGKTDFQEFGSAGGVVGDTIGVTLPLDVSVASDVTADDSFDPNNLTDSLARDLYTSLSIAKQQSGGTVQASDNDKLASIAAKNIQSFSAKSYTLTDFTIVEPTRASRTIFMSQFKNLQSISPIRPDELGTIFSAIENSASVPSDALERIKGYPDYVAKHIVVTVPSDISNEYVSYVNSLSGYLQMVALISNNDNDPAKAIGAIESTDSVLDSLKSSLDRLLAKL